MCLRVRICVSQLLRAKTLLDLQQSCIMNSHNSRACFPATIKYRFFFFSVTGEFRANFKKKWKILDTQSYLPGRVLKFRVLLFMLLENKLQIFQKSLE